VSAWALGASLALAIGTGAAAAEDVVPLDRPDPPGTVTEVKVGVFVMDVASIDDSTQTFHADFFVIQRWRDPRLSFQSSSVSGALRIVPASDVWQPDLEILNQRFLRAALPEQVRVSPDGSVLYRQRYQGTLASPLDLESFPFDRQELWVRVVSLQDAREVVLVPDPERIGRLPRFSIAGWDLELGQMESDSFEPIAGELALPRAGLPLHAKRSVGYFVWKLFVPLTLIVFMAWTVFFIGHDQMGPRIGISTASIFTLIAFQFSLGRVLPPISYLTRADQFVLGSSVLVYLALAETIFSGKLKVGGRADLAQRVDRHARWIYVTLFVVVATVTLGL
jgi:gamma-aminobutyric acid receptor subunit beta